MSTWGRVNRYEGDSEEADIARTLAKISGYVSTPLHPEAQQTARTLLADGMEPADAVNAAYILTELEET